MGVANENKCEESAILIEDNELIDNYQRKDNLNKKNEKRILLFIFRFFVVISLVYLFYKQITKSPSFKYTTSGELVYSNKNANFTDIKLSVIIPLHNTEQYIDRCMKSILKSTLKDMEIICIDDFSEDKSFEILKKYVDTDPRVRVIRLLKNKGVSYARNIAMKIANADYIGFMDSDDVVDPEYYENLYKQSEGYDIVVGKMCDSTNDTDGCVPRNLRNSSKMYGFVFDSLWRKKFIEDNNLVFPVGKVFKEDVDFRQKAYDLKPKMLYTEEEYYYHYKIRKNSACKYSNQFMKNLSKKIDDYENSKNNTTTTSTKV